MKIEYSSNNSGGYWWLDDQNWKDLESAGWKVDWKKDQPDKSGLSTDGRWLGALATNATREGLTKDEAIAEFERITGCNSDDAGCPCCGAPHNFYEE